jgi:hypothetical protein
MGVLKKLTDEYFCETVREEDLIVSKLLHKCIEKNRRESFVSLFKKWDDKNTYLMYKKDETLTNEAETMESTEALSWLKNKNKIFQFGYVGLSKETFLATPDFYRKNTPNYEKMDDNIKQVIDKFFEEFYKHPEIVSTYILFNSNRETKDKFHPFDIRICDVNDILDKKNAKKYSECIIIYFPSGFCDSFGERKFVNKMLDIIEELDDEFIKNGYERYIGTTIKNICPHHTDTRTALYVKKIKKRRG